MADYSTLMKLYCPACAKWLMNVGQVVDIKVPCDRCGHDVQFQSTDRNSWRWRTRR